MTVLQQARENEGYIIGLRREFHAEPELSLKEFHTADRIEEELEKMGISHWRWQRNRRIRSFKGHGRGRRHDCSPGGYGCAVYRRDSQNRVLFPKARRDARLRT